MNFDVFQPCPIPRALGYCAFLSLLLAGCGGGDDSSPTPTVQTQTPVLNQSRTDVLLNQTNIKTCATQTETGLACTPQALGDVHGLKQDAEVKAGYVANYTVVRRDNQDCIKDQNSDLTWELKTTDGGLREVEFGYYWYEPDLRKNGGSAGFEEYSDFGLAPGETCGNHLENCNTAAYLAKLNQQKYCGYSDWRLPTQAELTSLVDYGNTAPASAFEPLIFAPFVATVSGPYWTATPAASNNELAKDVSFLTGAVALSDKYNPSAVIAVRGDSSRRATTNPN